MRRNGRSSLVFTSHARRRPPWRRPASLTVLLLVASFVALLVYGVISSGPDDTIDSRLSESKAADAPDFELPVLARGRPGPLESRLGAALQDGSLASTELRGMPVVLNFWASWCPPCRSEAPELERAWQRFRGRGTVFLGLNMQDVTGDATSFLRERGITYPNVRDKSDEVARDWGVAALPETFFIDRRGRVVAHVIGAISERQLEEGIRAARAGRPAGAERGGDLRETR